MSAGPDDPGIGDGPVRLPREALDAVDWIDGEVIRYVWPTRGGFLVISTLRCVLLRQGDGLFHPSSWDAGPEYFYFNFEEPTVAGPHQLLLSETFYRERATRVEVTDPESVREQLSEARRAGQVEWARRRAATAGAEAGIRTALGDAPRSPGLALVPTLPCPYCGNLFAASTLRCPFCGAPRAPA